MTQIDLKNAKPKVIYVPPKIILYGRNGIGKSRFALKAPNPIFLDLDENIYELPVASNKTLGIPIKTYEDVMAFLGTLFNQDHEFKTLVVDSLSSLEKLVIEKVLKDSNLNSLASFQYGQGYQKMMPLWEQFLLCNAINYCRLAQRIIAAFGGERMRIKSPFFFFFNHKSNTAYSPKFSDSANVTFSVGNCASSTCLTFL